MTRAFFSRLIGLHRFGKYSFSQSGEDVITGFLFDCLGHKRGNYLDIGAHHPFYLNNTYFFYRKHWSGVNVDPLSDNIEQFSLSRPRDTNICCGIGAKTSLQELFVLEPKTLSTFDPEVARRYGEEGHKVEAVRQVKILSVKDLLDRCGFNGELDLLSIDIEGGELGVIRALMDHCVSPKVIVCETVTYAAKIVEAKKDKKLVEEIAKLGYLVYADTFVNTIFVSVDFWRLRK